MIAITYNNFFCKYWYITNFFTSDIYILLLIIYIINTIYIIILFHVIKGFEIIKLK